MTVGIQPQPGAVSWGAILAGAAAAAALSFLLMILGFGFGLLSVSPWAGQGASVAAIGFGTIIWLIIIQLAAAGLGGYLAGRLRVRWAGVDTDEVYFRDTAHGLLSWAVSTLVAVVFMGSSAAAVVYGGGQAAGAVVQQTAEEQVLSEELGYYADRVLRSTDFDSDDTQRWQDRRDEVGRVLARAIRQGGELDSDDRDYLESLIGSLDSSASSPDTQVDNVLGAIEARVEELREVSDDARQIAAWTAIWVFIGLLAGAFFAALTATWGGRQRDQVKGESL